MTDRNELALSRLLCEDPIGTIHGNAKSAVDYEEALDIPALEREWGDLRRTAGIKRIDASTFPDHRNRPMLVLYSAPDCLFCYVVKPTFARLVAFLDGIDVYYSDDESLRRQQGISYTPCLVAYLPNGRRAGTFSGTTTKFLWELMNLLPDLSEHLIRDAETAPCDGESCIVK